MTVTEVQLHPGAYFDSIVLMQLQLHLDEQPGVSRSAAVMATRANLEMLAMAGMRIEIEPAPDALLIVVEAATPGDGRSAIDSFDSWLRNRRRAEPDARRPRSLAAAALQLPSANWVAISTPGDHAPRLAREALELGKHVFLFSDNVMLEDEAALKKTASDRRLLLLGPDCGTALVSGVGLGFSNLAQRGQIGIVGASGTGIQYVVSRLAALGEGISQALGVGGRDLAPEIGGISTKQCMDLLGSDPGTRTRLLISKPADSRLLGPLLRRWQGEPDSTIVYIQGQTPPLRQVGSLTFAVDLDDLVDLALRPRAQRRDPPGSPCHGPFQGLFGGGTLAVEISGVLSSFGLSAPEVEIEDLGDDLNTRGRGHPMIDPRLRIEKIGEAIQRGTRTLLLDIVLGVGAASDPAADLAPAIELATRAGITVLCLLVGTDSDPQDRTEQADTLRAAGARVFERIDPMIEAILHQDTTNPIAAGEERPLATPLDVAGVLNVGLESFYDSLERQGIDSVQLDWRPPAGGRGDLADLLDRLRD